MRINNNKLDIALANQCKAATDLRNVLSPATITRVRQGRRIGTKTAGKLARALNVDVTEIIEQEAQP